MRTIAFLRFASSLVLLSVIGSTFLGCGEPQSLPFSMQVIPGQTEDSVPGQKCVFLVTVADEGENGDQGEAVDISATAPEGSAFTRLTTPFLELSSVHLAITPEQVAEIIVVPDEGSSGKTVVPDDGSPGKTLTVTIMGERGELEQTKTVSITVGEPLPDPGGLVQYATEIRDRFIPWLAANHPEFGITSETEWIPTVVCPHIVVVMYYLFFSEDWEMGVRWHVTIPPYDWAEIYLRHRTTEIHPSYGFRISSVTAQEEPQAVDPELSVWR